MAAGFHAGRHDPIFGPDGARAFERDSGRAEVHLLDGGHFLLGSAGEQVASLIRTFLDKQSSLDRQSSLDKQSSNS